MARQAREKSNIGGIIVLEIAIKNMYIENGIAAISKFEIMKAFFLTEEEYNIKKRLLLR